MGIGACAEHACASVSTRAHTCISRPRRRNIRENPTSPWKHHSSRFFSYTHPRFPFCLCLSFARGRARSPALKSTPYVCPEHPEQSLSPHNACASSVSHALPYCVGTRCALIEYFLVNTEKMDWSCRCAKKSSCSAHNNSYLMSITHTPHSHPHPHPHSHPHPHPQHGGKGADRKETHDTNKQTNKQKVRDPSIIPRPSFFF